MKDERIEFLRESVFEKKLMRVLVIPLLFAVLLVASATTVEAANFILQLRTDYEPRTDVTSLRYFVRNDSIPIGSIFIRPIDPPVTCSESINVTTTTDWSLHPQIASCDILARRGANMSGYLQMFNAAGEVVADRPFSFEWQRERTYILTMLMSKPSGDATKQALLINDLNSNGVANIGDTLRYVVNMTGFPGTTGTFTDQPPIDVSLVNGSVITSSGVVVEGNAAGDTFVRVEFTFDGTGSAGVFFDVLIEQRIVSNQGELRVQDLTYVGYFPTDDPTTTQVVDDPTLTSVPDDCDELVYALELELELLTGDDDGDGVVNVRDDCPKTGANAPEVDNNGCSLSQFCSLVKIVDLNSDAACGASDFQNDEPLSSKPGDCAFVGDTCVAVE